MRQVFENIGTIAGAGAVSPAGWGMRDLVGALSKGDALPDELIEHGDDGGFARVRRVPPQPKELRVKSPRLRRVSPVTKYLVSAAKEAVMDAGYSGSEPLGDRIGMVVAFMNGCVNYTNRFFGEVCEDAALASPLLFPETVFNAPASHVATVLGASGPVATHIGDSAALGEAISTAALWNASGETDACIIACAEEVDWLSAEGLAYYGRDFVACEGAAAFVIAPSSEGVPIACFERVAYTDDAERKAALASLGETAASQSSVPTVFGQGMGVAAGFELAAAWSRCCATPPPSIPVSTIFSGTNASAYKLTLGTP